MYGNWTAFSGHVKVHSLVLVVINKYIENNMQKHMLVVLRFGQRVLLLSILYILIYDCQNWRVNPHMATKRGPVAI